MLILFKIARIAGELMAEIAPEFIIIDKLTQQCVLNSGETGG